jgi:hypothetical protein
VVKSTIDKELAMGMRNGCALGVVVLGVLAGVAIVRAQDAKKTDPKYTMEEIMNKGHKGKESLLTKVTAGNAAEEDRKLLLEYYEALAMHEPPKGDAKSWKSKTEALVKAAKLAVEKPGAVAPLKAAANCKACHTAHRAS